MAPLAISTSPSSTTATMLIAGGRLDAASCWRRQLPGRDSGAGVLGDLRRLSTRIQQTWHRGNYLWEVEVVVQRQLSNQRDLSGELGRCGRFAPRSIRSARKIGQRPT
jgi:hypothetical protein